MIWDWDLVPFQVLDCPLNMAGHEAEKVDPKFSNAPTNRNYWHFWKLAFARYDGNSFPLTNNRQVFCKQRYIPGNVSQLRSTLVEQDIDIAWSSTASKRWKHVLGSCKITSRLLPSWQVNCCSQSNRVLLYHTQIHVSLAFDRASMRMTTWPRARQKWKKRISLFHFCLALGRKGKSKSKGLACLVPDVTSFLGGVKLLQCLVRDLSVPRRNKDIPDTWKMMLPQKVVS